MENIQYKILNIKLLKDDTDIADFHGLDLTSNEVGVEENQKW